METIDDWWASYCALSRHGQQFIGYLQERDAFGLSASIWQVIYNAYIEYMYVTDDNVSFYLWLKSENLILI